MLNKVILIGNVGNNPEIKNVGNSMVANFSLATTEGWKDKRTGDWVNKTEWHKITIWNEGLVNYVERNVTKGDRLYIEGSLQTNEWKDRDGNKRYTTEVVLKAFNGTLKMLSNKERSNSTTTANYGNGNGLSQDLNDDIPF